MADLPEVSLSESLRDWGTPAFNETFVRECQALASTLLPLLQQGLSHGSYAVAEGMSAIILSVGCDADALRVRARVLYGSVIAGCSCADDPTPIDIITEQCELRFTIDRRSALAEVEICAD